MKTDTRLLLDNIRSVHNAGSIFRTAETIGIELIYCAGTTPMPLDRFGRKRKDFAKVALGAEDLLKWERVDDPLLLIEQLKKEDFSVIALEQHGRSLNYKNVQLAKKSLIIIGNEVDGVQKSFLDVADVIAEIPIKGKKESLNVAVAAGVALFEWLA